MTVRPTNGDQIADSLRRIADAVAGQDGLCAADVRIQISSYGLPDAPRIEQVDAIGARLQLVGQDEVFSNGHVHHRASGDVGAVDFCLYTKVDSARDAELEALRAEVEQLRAQRAELAEVSP